jgi:hypothetical protein
MTTTTEELTDEQRTEVRRTLLQSIGEIGRGLELAKLMLKQGKFSSAKDVIAGTEAMLVLHEGMAQLLLKENTRLEELLLSIDSMLSEHYVTLYGTSSRMLEQGALPKSERPAGYDHEATMRYSAYAAQARSIMLMVRDKLKP